MRYLVTGGAGFIGSNLVNRLLDEGNEVTLFDNLSRKGVVHNLEWLKAKKNKSLSVIRGDVRNPAEIGPACKDVDAIYHTAAQVAVTTSVANPREDFEINALGTFNVLEGARKSNTSPTLIFTSTNKVYGALDDAGIEELETRYDFKDLKRGVPSGRPIEPHTPYGCSKGAADSYCLDYSRIYGMNNVVFRMSCIYGTRQFGNVDQGWVVHFILTHLLQKPIAIYGDGKQVRDILFVDDLVNAFQLATRNISRTKGRAYAIGGGPSFTISLLELVGQIERSKNRKFDLKFEEWRPSDQKVYYSDISKAKQDFGWAPQVSPADGVGRLYDWASSNISLFKS